MGTYITIGIIHKIYGDIFVDFVYVHIYNHNIRYKYKERKVNHMTKTTDAQKKATAKYICKLDEIKIRVPKGKKEEYRQMAEAEGKSLNQFIIDRIEGKES
jgi:predicted HicB family RNase H-like nuclease